MRFLLATSCTKATDIIICYVLVTSRWPSDAHFTSIESLLMLRYGNNIICVVCMLQFSIKFLAIPAIIALLAWLAISHPQATANTVFTVLEFVKEHPAAASIGTWPV